MAMDLLFDCMLGPHVIAVIMQLHGWQLCIQRCNLIHCFNEKEQYLSVNVAVFPELLKFTACIFRLSQGL
jgi:hypothetical protein